jgi:hypothetical protein
MRASFPQARADAASLPHIGWVEGGKTLIAAHLALHIQLHIFFSEYEKCTGMSHARTLSSANEQQLALQTTISGNKGQPGPRLKSAARPGKEADFPSFHIHTSPTSFRCQPINQLL